MLVVPAKRYDSDPMLLRKMATNGVGYLVTVATSGDNSNQPATGRTHRRLQRCPGFELSLSSALQGARGIDADTEVFGDFSQMLAGCQLAQHCQFAER